MKKFKRLLACLLAVALCCMPVFAVCADGEDNDVVDDWDGEPEPDPEPEYYNGDLNHDGKVDLVDLGILDKYFIYAVTEEEFDIKLANFNGDEKVDLVDLGILDKFFIFALSDDELEEYNLPK